MSVNGATRQMRKPNIIGLGEYEIEDLLAEIARRTDVNRLEIVDHSPCSTCGGSGFTISSSFPTDAKTTTILKSILCSSCEGRRFIGRQVVMWSDKKKIDLSFQDEGKTLKVFVDERTLPLSS